MKTKEEKETREDERGETRQDKTRHQKTREEKRQETREETREKRQEKRDKNATMDERETEARQCQKTEGYFTSSTQRIQSSKKKQKCEEKAGNPDRTCYALQDGNRETLRLKNNCKSKFACIVEASESTRMRMEGISLKIHEDHMAGKGAQFTTTLQFGAQIYSVPQATKTLAAKAAVDKEW